MRGERLDERRECARTLQQWAGIWNGLHKPHGSFRSPYTLWGSEMVWARERTGSPRDSGIHEYQDGMDRRGTLGSCDSEGACGRLVQQLDQGLTSPTSSGCP